MEAVTHQDTTRHPSDHGAPRPAPPAAPRPVRPTAPRAARTVAARPAARPGGPRPPRPGAAVALLAAALRARRTLALRYGGAWRVVQPHVLGRSARGRLSLLAWQVEDERGGRGEGWRLFDLGRLEALEPRREGFAPRGGTGPRSPIARRIAAA